VQLPVKVAGAALVAIMAVYLSFGPRLSERAGHDRGTRPESPDAASLRPDAASGGEPRLSLPTLTGPPQESLDASREAHQRAQSPAPDASRPSSAAEGPRTAQRNLMKDDARLATPALQGVEVDGYLRGIAIGRGRVQVAELVARLGGTVLADRTEVGDAVIDIALPRARYDELARELAQLGQWSAVSRPVAARSPAAAERAGGDQMRILVRILE
jgi:hypothetical protein